MLQIGHGQTAARVLKPLEDGGRAVRELAFYRAVFPEIAVPPLGDLTPPQPPQFPGPDDDKARLRALVPAFYGVVHVPLEPDTPPHHIRSRARGAAAAGGASGRVPGPGGSGYAGRLLNPCGAA